MKEEVNNLSSVQIRIYIEQYRQCFEMWRHLNSLAWQVPTSALTIGGALIIAAYQFTYGLVRSLLLGFTSIILFLMMIQMAKHRLGIDNVSVYMKFLSNIFKVEAIPQETTEIINFIESHSGWKIRDRIYHGFLIKQRAYFCFQYSILSFIGVLIVMALISLLL